MLIIFLRSLIVYCIVFAVIRIMGKRQISELQPFDLIFTLLIADVASHPISDTGIPLVYGIIPIFALFLMQQGIAYASLKSEKARALFAGRPQIVIARGVVQEEVMRSARYTINDLMEQLRSKDVFDIADVNYAIIETDGTLSVMLKGTEHTPTVKDLKLKEHEEELSELVVLDGKLHPECLKSFKRGEEWLMNELNNMGFTSLKELLIVSISPDGKLFVQTKQKHGSLVRTKKTSARSGS